MTSSSPKASSDVCNTFGTLQKARRTAFIFLLFFFNFMRVFPQTFRGLSQPTGFSEILPRNPFLSSKIFSIFPEELIKKVVLMHMLFCIYRRRDLSSLSLVPQHLNTKCTCIKFWSLQSNHKFGYLTPV